MDALGDDSIARHKPYTLAWMRPVCRLQVSVRENARLASERAVDAHWTFKE